MTFRLHPLAEAEALTTARFDENEVGGLGFEFVDEVDRGIELIVANPLLGQVVAGTVRRIVLRRFPYSLVYRMTDSGLQIIAVAHHSRTPGYWRLRLY